MEEIVESLKGQRFQDSTKDTCHWIWRRFNCFFIRLYDRPKSWENRLILFLGHLIEDCKLQSSSVKSYISAIKGDLAVNRIKLNQDDFMINSLTRACKIKNDSIITWMPIRKDVLHLTLREVVTWANEKNQPYLKALYLAIFSTAYYRLLRVGEVAKSSHSVLADNVHITTNKHKILLVLKSSKTHSKGNHPQKIKISSTPSGHEKKNQQFCPFALLCNFTVIRPHTISEVDLFFVFADWSPVSCATSQGDPEIND